MSGIGITRRDLAAGEVRGAAGKRRDARAARRMPALAPVWKDEPWSRHRFERRWRRIGGGQPGPAEWTGRPCGVRRIRKGSGGQFPRRTGSGTMPKVWRDCPAAGRGCGFHIFRLPGWRGLALGSRPARTPRNPDVSLACPFIPPSQKPHSVAVQVRVRGPLGCL